MEHASIKTGLAFVLGGVLLASPAYAVSPRALDSNSSLLVPAGAGDVENEEIMRDMETGVTTPEAAGGKEGEAPQAAPAEKPKKEGHGSDDIEEEEMKEDGLNVPE